MEIISGIHKIDGIRGANCYLVTSGTGMLVIDTGMPGNGNRIVNYIKGLGKKPSDINYVVLTHADIDHVGSAAEIKKMTSAKLAIHEDEAAVLTGKTRGKHVKGLPGLLFKLMSPLVRFHTVEPDIILKDNMDIAGFKVIHTPGHTNGSICLYQSGKIIFVGDALRSDSNGNPRSPSKSMSVDVVQAKASLIAISELEFDSLLPGHGTPMIGQASAKLKNMVKDLKRDDQISNAKNK